MVIGPTPPGTGVMAPATLTHSSYVDVADELALAVRPDGTRLMPTSMTMAPGRIQSP